MVLRNCIGFETRHGYRTFELYEGDLTEPEAAADLLVVSAFAGEYTPVPGTVLGALHEKWNLDLRKIARALDVTQQLGFWLSEPLSVGHFKRLLCIELLRSKFSTEEALSNVFPALALIDAKGIEIKKVALPLLGAGNQKIAAEEVMRSLIPSIRRALEQSFSLERIVFVEKSAERAALLSDGINALLGRPAVGLPKGQLVGDLLRDLCARLDTLVTGNDPASVSLLRDMRRLLGQTNVRSFEVGMLARRLVELIVDNQLGPTTLEENLALRVGRLRENNIASWTISYMHTLRLFGNESAHERNRKGLRPPHVSEEDLAICLFCMHRLLDFWATYCLPKESN